MQNEGHKSLKKNKLFLNILLLIIVAALAVIPLYTARNAEFAGVDGYAEEAITQIKPDYKPWFSPVFEPKSGEVESLLFALQAAIGAGVIGYCLGYMRGRKRKENETRDEKG